jgi:hypothetical protein
MEDEWSVNVRFVVGLSLVVAGFLAIYLAVALSFAAIFRDYVLPSFFLGIVLIAIGVRVINPLGIWSDST